jgi:hypothetical protein
MKDFRGPDGTAWRVSVRSPGSTNAMVLFRHPEASSSRRDRYAWYVQSTENRNVTSRLVPDDVLAALSDGDLARLFRRSMPVSTERPAPERG